MPLFNAVLLPVADFRDRIVDYAQDHYADIADGYCLSPSVYPHITLCQFEADDQPMVFINGLFNPFFEESRLREGDGIHAGFHWVEWTVDKEDWLIELQSTVCESLEADGVSLCAGQGADYYPHMTFARLPAKRAETAPLPAIEQSSKPWIFTIGSSDKNGQFLG